MRLKQKILIYLLSLCCVMYACTMVVHDVTYAETVDLTDKTFSLSGNSYTINRQLVPYVDYITIDSAMGGTAVYVGANAYNTAYANKAQSLSISYSIKSDSKTYANDSLTVSGSYGRNANSEGYYEWYGYITSEAARYSIDNSINEDITIYASAPPIGRTTFTVHYKKVPQISTNLTGVTQTENKDANFQITATFPSSEPLFVWEKYVGEFDDAGNMKSSTTATAIPNSLVMSNIYGEGGYSAYSPQVNDFKYLEDSAWEVVGVTKAGSYTKPNVALADSGTFYRTVLISGISGVNHTVSATAELTVIPKNTSSIEAFPLRLSMSIGDPLSIKDDVIVVYKYNNGTSRAATGLDGLTFSDGTLKKTITVIGTNNYSVKYTEYLDSTSIQKYSTTNSIDFTTDNAGTYVYVSGSYQLLSGLTKYDKNGTENAAGSYVQNLVESSFIVKGADAAPPVINGFDAYWSYNDAGRTNASFVDHCDYLNASDIKKKTDLTLHVSAQDNSGVTPTYKWYKDGVAITGEESDTYTIADAKTANGKYTCEAHDGSKNHSTTKEASIAHKEIIIDTKSPTFNMSDKTGGNKSYAEIYIESDESDLSANPYLFINMGAISDGAIKESILSDYGTSTGSKAADNIEAAIEANKGTPGWSTKPYTIFDPYGATGSETASNSADYVVATKDIAGNVSYMKYTAMTAQVPTIKGYSYSADQSGNNYIAVSFVPESAKCWIDNASEFNTEVTAKTGTGTKHNIGSATAGTIHVKSGDNPIISVPFNVVEGDIVDATTGTSMATVVINPLSFAQEKTITVKAKLGNVEEISISKGFTEVKKTENSNTCTATVTENGTYKIMVKNGAMLGTKDVVIDNIDNVRPTIEGLKVTGDAFTFTAKDLASDTSVASGLYSVEYVYENGSRVTLWVRDPVTDEYTKNCSLPIEKAGTYTITVTDKVGLTAQESKTVSESDLKANNNNIDTSTGKITGVTIQKTPTDWTKDYVTLSISMDETDLNTVGRYSWDGGTSWTNNKSWNVTKNGSYYVLARDKYGKTYPSDTVGVTNIDQDAPKISVTGSGKSYTASCSDPNSGIKWIKYSGGQYTSTQVKDFSGSHPSTANTTIECTVNGTYTVQCSDMAGNESTQSFMVSGMVDGKSSTTTTSSEPVIKYVYRDSAPTVVPTEVKAKETEIKVTPITNTETSETTTDANRVGITTRRHVGSGQIDDSEKEYLIPEIISDLSTPLTKKGSTPEDESGLDSETSVTKKTFKLPIIILIVVLALGVSTGIAVGIMSTDKKKTSEKKNKQNVLNKKK